MAEEYDDDVVREDREGVGRWSGRMLRLIDDLQGVGEGVVLDAEGRICFDCVVKYAWQGRNEDWIGGKEFIPSDVLPLLTGCALDGRMARKLVVRAGFAETPGRQSFDVDVP